jgi:hypothetical protein
MRDATDLTLCATEAPEPRALTPATSALIRELSDLTRRKRRTGYLQAGFGLLFCALAIANVVLVYRTGRLSGFTEAWWVGPAVLMLIGSFATASRREHDLARALEVSASVEAIGPLAEALKLPRMDRFIITTALKDLLPLLRPGDSALLSSYQRACLIEALRMKPNDHARFLIALLNALAQLGDPEALPAVERLANRHARSDRERRVQETAIDCRQALIEAAGARRSRETLLRPSEGTQPEALLRAAVATGEEPARLLRAAEE